jgi:hypothetical protein
MSRISRRGIYSTMLLEELLRFSEAAFAWLSFPLEHLKIREKALREILLQ